MAAAAIPAISLGAQYFMNRGKNKQISQNQSAATTGLQGSATDLSKFSGTLGNAGTAFLGDAQKNFGKAGTSFDAAGSYFSPVLSGSRGAMDAALAPERAGITDTYRGAGKAVESMRGGTGDLARAELNRDRAGKLALLPSQARQTAATGMLQVGQGRGNLATAQAGTGTGIFGQATGAKAASAQAYSNLFSGANRQSETQAAYGNQSGGAIGSMIFDALKSGGKKVGGGKSAGTAAPTGQSFWGGVTAPTFGG
jgi:hypothetical protein